MKFLFPLTLLSLALVMGSFYRTEKVETARQRLLIQELEQKVAELKTAPKPEVPTDPLRLAVRERMKRLAAKDQASTNPMAASMKAVSGLAKNPLIKMMATSSTLIDKSVEQNF